MRSAWLSLIQAGQLGLEAQCVIGLRMMRLAQGGRLAEREAQRMVVEKAAALAAAQAGAIAAFAAGKPPAIIARNTFNTYRWAVRRNRRRLSR